MKDFAPRTQVVDYLKSVLYGPQGGPSEEIQGTPLLRYMTGMLFPLGDAGVGDAEALVTATAEEETKADADDGDTNGDAPREIMELAFEALPSAVGLSFRVLDKAVVECCAWGARYHRQGEEKKSEERNRSTTKWRRVPLATPGEPDIHKIKKGADPVVVFKGLAQVVTRWRSMGDGTAIVTVTLVNLQKNNKRGIDVAKTLFQVGLRCSVQGHGILPYPEINNPHAPGSEEAEVAFLYRESTPFARGHGTAATWGESKDARVEWVGTDFIPAVDIPYATFKLPEEGVNEQCLDIGFLDIALKDKVIKALRTLPTAYAAWIDQQKKVKVKPEFAEVSSRFIARAADWVRRMESGIKLLESSDDTWWAFHMANRAMGMQMVLSKNLRAGPYPVADRKRVPAFDFAGLTWRPFQVAFMLSTLESLVNLESDDRHAVDVIWFPTGGGKTEAYLFVTAFELLRRRIVHGSNDTATAVLSRYTLRLLTAQQFQRTGALVVALELLRKQNPEKLGSVRPFSLGLWVGMGLTPNNFRKAHEIFTEQYESRRPENKFLLLACPCCGTEIFPKNPKREGEHWRMSDFGIVSTQAKFQFRCPNTDCEFSSEAGLPLNVVDDALYDSPPSILLGTMDKFALLPWDDRSRVFFGGPGDNSVPPSLVIQDELHLISGPLGSLTAPYEAAIDTIIKSRGAVPKRIGSTATIRNAADQVRGLYGRKVAVFPTPCGRWDDAFFFSTDRDKPGRQYVGAMGQGYIKPVVAMAWTAAALLQSVKEVKLDDQTLDAYWSLLVYHNSRRELGRTLTAARDEVATRVEAIAKSQAIVRATGEPLELSAQMVKSMSEALSELERKHTANQPAVDFVPCTSIISVGVDVDRLGLMMVNGQPKLTSEYIQATSRVGRGKTPGLVVTLFSPSKPRDRSHYEDFRAYHEAIYRHVEPTSVTPYALPARERTLHAALVAVARHALQWKGFDKAGDVDFDDPLTQETFASLLKLMCASDTSEEAALKAFAQERLDEWDGFAESHGKLLYEAQQAGTQFPALLYQYGRSQSNALWPTMKSVRNVDAEAEVMIK